MKKLIVKIYLCMLPSLFLLSMANVAAASSSSSRPPTGITVSPAYVNVNILSGEQQVPVYFTLTNNEPSTQSITLRTADFSALNYSGGLLFVGSNAKQLQKEYGLAHWLSLPVTSLSLAPKETTKVSVDINNDPTLSPGGHYGGLLFSVGSPTQISQENKVSVQPVASALMFVTKLNGATYKLGLSKVADNDSFFSLPSEATLLFYNNGNSQVTPRGYVTVTSSSGKLISKGIINTDSGLVLPGNSRYFEVPLQKLQAANQIGNYKLTVNFTFDGLNTYRQYQTGLYLGAPMLIVGLILALIVVSVLLYLLVKNQKAILLPLEDLLARRKKTKKEPFILPKARPLEPVSPTSVVTNRQAPKIPIREVSKVKVAGSLPKVKKVRIKDDSTVEVKLTKSTKPKPDTKQINIK